MDVSSFTLRLLFLFFPGIIAALILESLTVHRKWSQFQFVINSFMLGCFSYVFYQLTIYLFDLIAIFWRHQFLTNSVSFLNSLFDNSIPINLKEIFLSVFFGIFTGALSTLAYNKRLLIWLGRKLRLTEKYGDDNLFYYFLSKKSNGWVWIRISNNDIIYEGFREAFSESDSHCEVLLSDVNVYRIEDSQLLYNLDKIYLSMKPGEYRIECPTKGVVNGNETPKT